MLLYICNSEKSYSGIKYNFTVYFVPQKVAMDSTFKRQYISFIKDNRKCKRLLIKALVYLE